MRFIKRGARRFQPGWSAAFAVFVAAALATLLSAPVSVAVSVEAPPINGSNWGMVTSPVYGTHEAAPYAKAELFAGPAKFGDYYAGVLPNGFIVTPAGICVQVGMNPLGAVLTPDGKFLVTSNDDERERGRSSLQAGSLNAGGYSLSVIDTRTMRVVSTLDGGPLFIGMQVTGTGPYRIWASGGPSNDVKLFDLSPAGVITASNIPSIPIAPITPSAEGFVSNYTPAESFNTADADGDKPPAPSDFNRTAGAHITFPAGSALSPDHRFLYVACNGDNSLAVMDTISLKVVAQIPVGYFPYGVSVSADGTRVLVSNWGITQYRFANPTYQNDLLTGVGMTGKNEPDGFFVPRTSTGGDSPKTSSVSIVLAPGGNGALCAPAGAIYEGKPLDGLIQVGDTHPTAMTVVTSAGREMLYVTRSNDDSIGIIPLDRAVVNTDADGTSTFDLSLVTVSHDGMFNLHGAQPNAIVASPDGARVYVAEAGIDSVAVLDTRRPTQPVLLGRIPTGWYPTGLALSRDGKDLYILNAKGIGEDINPATKHEESFVDSNFVFGMVQKVDVGKFELDNTTVLHNTYALHLPADTSIVPVGGLASRKIKHVVFILHENKTFDSMLGSKSSAFGPFASLRYNKADGSPITDIQYTGIAGNIELLATTFGTAVSYYSDSEESDAGHQFCASGTASDYTEKTLAVKEGRGLLVNKNFDPEDYPESGYIFNNAARHGVSFKDYGAMIRIVGTDTGSSLPARINDPLSGLIGLPQVEVDKRLVISPLVNKGDVTSPTRGLGQSYFLALPVLSVLGGTNSTGEPRLDTNYPGFNFNISDQRRALEFCRDFDRMVHAGTLPTFLYVYLPNDHTGRVETPNRADVGTSPLQQVADGDVAMGMVVSHIMQSRVYYDPETNTGSAIFITFDDAQSTKDHIDQHRTPLVVVSPYAKPHFMATRHYSTASIVKTEELLLGLPPNNFGDLFATDLRDLFQPNYNHITASSLPFSRMPHIVVSSEGKRIWDLVSHLDTSAPDRDSSRLGALAELSIAADRLHAQAARRHYLNARSYKSRQSKLYQSAVRIVLNGSLVDSDD